MTSFKIKEKSLRTFILTSRSNRKTMADNSLDRRLSFDDLVRPPLHPPPRPPLSSFSQRVRPSGQACDLSPSPICRGESAPAHPPEQPPATATVRVRTRPRFRPPPPPPAPPRGSSCLSDQSSLELMRRHLQKKYLAEAELVQRQVAGDPESWTSSKFQEATREVGVLHNLLALTERLAFKPESEVGSGSGSGSGSGATFNSGSDSEYSPTSGEDDVEDDLACPICFEDFGLGDRRQIFSCSNGHGVCKPCLDGSVSKQCSVCREDFRSRPAQENKLAAKLVETLRAKYVRRSEVS